MSHEVVLGGKLAAKTSFSLSRPSSPRVEDLKGELGSPGAAPGGSPTLPGHWVQPQPGWGLTPSPLSPGATLYSRLKEYLLTEAQLKENGYPFPHPEKPGGAVIFTTEEKKPKDCEYLLRHRPWGGGAIWGQGTPGPGWPDALPFLLPHPHSQPPAGSAAAAAPSTSCPPPAAACATRSVTTTGGGSAGTEVRPPLGRAGASSDHL